MAAFATTLLTIAAGTWVGAIVFLTVIILLLGLAVLSLLGVNAAPWLTS